MQSQGGAGRAPVPWAYGRHFPLWCHVLLPQNLVTTKELPPCCLGCTARHMAELESQIREIHVPRREGENISGRMETAGWKSVALPPQGSRGKQSRTAPKPGMAIVYPQAPDTSVSTEASAALICPVSPL